MFTGIIETTGTILSVEENGTNKSFCVKSALSAELKVDQSVSHSGVCLTVEAVAENQHKVTAILETLQKTNIGHWQTGTLVNIERCLPMNGRLDGHIVQGHVDCTATCLSVENENGSWQYTFEYPVKFAHLVIEKGSICINGISLTAFNIGNTTLSVAIIPYTYEYTNIQQIKSGDVVNFEFDILGKYMARWNELGRRV
jgi:riboflavin synthase